ncbi:MAG TPA: hypothetical protein DEO60_03525 [Bacteroidales bacterium]|nr:hypothetical protein [Bacteroidales bacterium]
MFTYVDPDRILFSSDGFGQHFASAERFDDQIKEDIMPHARKYFANILLLYAPLIIKLIDKFKSMPVTPSMICPDHGIIFRKNPSEILNAYREWSEQKPKRKALVIYDTMWHSTEKMAYAIVDALTSNDVDATPMHLKKWNRSDIITEALDAGAIIIGSPTLNNGLFPTVSDFLTYMKGLKPQNKIGAAFGSYGWSGEAPKIVLESFRNLKLKIFEETASFKFSPGAAKKDFLIEFGKKFAQKLLEECSETKNPGV